jgi:glycosyltransferase involved in cell wall biosynthesis
LEDNLPLSILEAMACCLPVVATRVGGIPECVVDGETGFVVPPKDSESMAKALIELIQNKARRRQMGRAGRRHSEANFSRESQVRRLELVFERVLKEAAA